VQASWTIQKRSWARNGNGTFPSPSLVPGNPDGPEICGTNGAECFEPLLDLARSAPEHWTPLCETGVPVTRGFVS
jgi:hypothetical protein